MLKTYCSQCGNPNFYSQAKPKFCSHCGTPFYTMVVKEKTTNLKSNKSQTINKLEMEDTEDDDLEEDDAQEEATPIPDISGLDVDISFEKPRKESLGNIAGTVPDAFSYTGERIDSKISSKEVLKQIKKESSTLREK